MVGRYRARFTKKHTVLPVADIKVYVVPLRSYGVRVGAHGAGGCIDLDQLDFALEPYEIGEYRISRMFIRDRGKGTGTKIMSMLCTDADVAKASLVLEASPYHDRTPEGVARLMRFYGRFGFKEIEGHPETMRRVPS